MSLSVRNLTVTLGKKRILHGIDLNIPTGSFFTLLGPSGCGKSTLLKAIVGLLPYDGGHVLWNGEEIDALPPEKRGMVMAFQDLRVFPHMTVLDNVAFPLKMAGIKKEARHRRAREMLAQVQLEELESRRPHQLSGGQQQRVILARALVACPKVLLLDEPFSSLDASLRVEMRELVYRLHRNFGTTMVLVTHDQMEALAMSDAMAVMAPGHILQTGAPQDIYQNPNSPDVARYFFQENQIEGRVFKREFTCAGLSFGVPDAIPDGAVVAFFPPESLALKEKSGSFTVERLEYAGSHLKATVTNGEISLYTSILPEQSDLLGHQVTLCINAEKALLFSQNSEMLHC